MNAKSCVSLMAIILTTGLNLTTTQAHQFDLTSTCPDYNKIILSFSPPRRGKPGGRNGAGTRFAPIGMNQLEATI
jgi:hypothetical protein